MRVALSPITVKPRQNKSNLRSMAQAVEDLRGHVDLIVFPQIEVFEDPDFPGTGSLLDRQGELVSGFGRKRSVFVAGGFWESRKDGHFAMLYLADRMGQMDVRVRRLESEGHSGPILCAGVSGKRVAIVLSDDLFDAGLVDNLKAARADMLVVPLWVAGQRSDAEGTLVEISRRLGETARQSGVSVLAVNSNSASELSVGACGGAFLFDGQGQPAGHRAPGDCRPFLLEMPDPSLEEI
ncbi:carbon-nitrogen hydrolase family protein [bacterium]|nr:carbon-nitrogen hydrolase family protein [bacterium]